MIYNRKTKDVIEESEYGSRALNFLYNNLFGRLLLKIIINPFFSRLYGKYNSTKRSKKKIEELVSNYNIDLNEYEEKDYNSFNDFFTRKRKNIEYDKDVSSFISPADSKLTVSKIEENMEIKIKQSMYTIEELVADDINLDGFKDGNCLVFRLSVDDYHRYCFIDDGTVIKTKSIKGKLHTVRSISEKYKVYSHNSRIWTLMNTKNFGEVLFIEVGALMVGKIQNNNKKEFVKGEEKGYFEFGGSTIVILTNDKVKIDRDIIEYSNKGIETKVKYGEKIGELKC